MELKKALEYQVSLVIMDLVIEAIHEQKEKRYGDYSIVKVYRGDWVLLCVEFHPFGNAKLKQLPTTRLKWRGIRVVESYNLSRFKIINRRLAELFVLEMK